MDKTIYENLIFPGPLSQFRLKFAVPPSHDDQAYIQPGFVNGSRHFCQRAHSIPTTYHQHRELTLRPTQALAQKRLITDRSAATS